MWNYTKWLKNKLVEIAFDLSLTDYEFEVVKEQNFEKPDLTWNKITVVIKALTENKVFQTTVKPYQIMVLSEENGLEASQIIFTKLFQDYNFYQLKDGTTTYKMQYNNPVVLNNFNIVGVGERSVLYVNATLFQLDNIADLDDLTVNNVVGKLFIDSEKIDAITFSLSYTMTGDTKTFPDQKFATTIRSVQTLNISLTTPCIQNSLFTKLNTIFSASASGNTSFSLKFKLSGVDYNLSMKLISCEFVTSPAEAPSLQLGFML